MTTPMAAFIPKPSPHLREHYLPEHYVAPGLGYGQRLTAAYPIAKQQSGIPRLSELPPTLRSSNMGISMALALKPFTPQRKTDWQLQASPQPDAQTKDQNDSCESGAQKTLGEAQTPVPSRRPLTGNEQFYYHSAKHRDGWGMSALCLRVKAPLPSPDQIQEALACLQQSHVGLNVRIDEGQEPWQPPAWQHLNNSTALPFSITLANNDNTWQEALQQFIRTNLDPAQAPLVQFKFIWHPQARTCDILLGFHHALMDGASAWHLMQYFTQACWAQHHSAMPSCSTKPDAMSCFFQPQNKTLPLEQACNLRATHEVALNTFIDSLKNGIAKVNSEALTIDETTSQQPKEIQFSRITLTSDVVTKLTTQCRKQDTNLNGAITALALSASRKYFHSCWPGITPIQYLVPISFRKHIGNWPAEDLGVCVGSSNHLHMLKPPSQEDFWETARHCKAKIHSTIQSGVPETTFHLLENLQTPSRKDGLIFAQMPKHYILVNNLGKVPVPDAHNDFEYEALSWATHQEPNSPVVQYYFASLGDKLSLTVQSSQLTQKELESLAREIEANIKTLINSDTQNTTQ